MLECASLAGRYGRILIFDTETTGLSPSNDRIIQFSAAVFTRKAQGYQLAQQVDRLVALPPGRKVPPKIQSLTGITDADLAQRGIPQAQLCREVEALLDGPDTLLLAYNAQFDLSFLYYTLARTATLPYCVERTSWICSRYTGTAGPIPTGWKMPWRPTVWAERCTTATGPWMTCWPLRRSWAPWRLNKTILFSTSIYLVILSGMVSPGGPSPR